MTKKSKKYMHSTFKFSLPLPCDPDELRKLPDCECPIAKAVDVAFRAIEFCKLSTVLLDHSDHDRVGDVMVLNEYFGQPWHIELDFNPNTGGLQVYVVPIEGWDYTPSDDLETVLGGYAIENLDGLDDLDGAIEAVEANLRAVALKYLKCIEEYREFFRAHRGRSINFHMVEEGSRRLVTRIERTDIEGEDNDNG